MLKNKWVVLVGSIGLGLYLNNRGSLPEFMYAHKSQRDAYQTQAKMKS